MELSSQSVFEAALKLPESEQVALVTRLLDHLSPEDLVSIDDPMLLNELDRRFADEEGAIPWSELKTER
jgi:hypothetical protein